ncbi:unnamed protein product [Prorocentrum cordatum]|uniref:Uncharacterized protein n=1 Tax=Prorocentrum cordatum TaxID=2364126 RepID=A0ABN9TXS9_9DINO|nr:unnamed protein product [Polarella glacialis]
MVGPTLLTGRRPLLLSLPFRDNRCPLFWPPLPQRTRGGDVARHSTPVISLGSAALAGVSRVSTTKNLATVFMRSFPRNLPLSASSAAVLLLPPPSPRRRSSA